MSATEPPVSGQAGLTCDALLAGPRGRSLCTNLLDDRLTTLHGKVPRPWVHALHYLRAGDVSRGARLLRECVGLADLSRIPFDGGALLTGLAVAVGFASYSDEPDNEDQGFADEAARAALRPVAEAVITAMRTPGLHWWTAPVDRERQRYTQFLDDHPLPEPLLAGAPKLAAAWLADTLGYEHSAPDRPEDPAVPYGGRWWSTPELSRLPVTTRAIPTLGAVALPLTEAGLGWRSARCWPVAPEVSARVYEVHGPGQWTDLVSRYPLDVTKSRRHEWWRATGRAGHWLIPDYVAVAADWDAVHVSVAGYLTIAGIAIPAGDGTCTMLAGWNPDATWWLNDVLSPASPPEDWRRDNQAPFSWARL